jgi:hypothetical protein
MGKRMLIPGFTAGVAGFLVGWVLWRSLIAPFVPGDLFLHDGLLLPSAQVNLIGLFLANLIFGSLIGWFGWRLRITSFIKGFGTSLLFGFVAYASLDLIIGTASGTNLFSFLVNITWAGIMGALAMLVLHQLKSPIERRFQVE